MDLDQYLEPEFDFSLLDMEELRSMGDLALSELISVFRSNGTTTVNMPGWPLSEFRYLAVGISHRARCLFILYRYRYDKIYFTDVNYATDEDIKRFWC